MQFFCTVSERKKNRVTQKILQTWLLKCTTDLDTYCYGLQNFLFSHFLERSRIFEYISETFQKALSRNFWNFPGCSRKFQNISVSSRKYRKNVSHFPETFPERSRKFLNIPESSSTAIFGKLLKFSSKVSVRFKSILNLPGNSRKFYNISESIDIFEKLFEFP